MRSLCACGARVIAMALLVACGARTPVPTPSGGAPSIMATPDRAQQGDSITLTGMNWPPRAQVTLAFSPVSQVGNAPISLGVTAADEQGRISFVTIVPQAATPGGWSIAARGDEPQQSASIAFTVLAADVTATATAIAPAQTLFPTPSITPQPSPTTVPPTATATRVPPTAAATAAATAPAAPQPQPSLAGTLRGGKLTLRSEGWAGGERVTISVSKNKDGRDAVRLDELKADDKGRVESSARLPRQARDAGYVIAASKALRVIALLNRGD